MSYKSNAIFPKILFALLLTASFFLISADAAFSRELRLGAYKYLSDDDMKKVLQPFVNYLSASIKAPVKLYVTSTYSELSQRFISGEMDMAIIPPYAYVKLADKIKLQLLTSMKLEGSYYYNGVVVVSSKSGINSLEQLKGKRFSYVAQDSASGYLYPRILFKKNGLDPDGIFSKISYSGSHAESIKSIINGTSDGASIFKGSIEMARCQGIDTSGLKIIAETEKIPHEAFIAQSNMNPELVRSLKQALVSFRYNENALNYFTKIQRSVFKMEGWVVGFDTLYDTVREAQKFFPNPELENPDRDTSSVTIGFYPRGDVESTRKAFEPLINYLSKETGIKFKLAFSPNYLDVGNQMMEGNYNFALLTPMAFLMMREKSVIPVVPLAQRVASQKTSYAGVIVCKNNLGIKSIADLKDKVFAFVDPDSISGRLYPLALFKKSNMSIKTFFKKTYYAGSPKKALQDVLSGAADACATNEHEFEVTINADAKAKAQVTAIYKTPEIPNDYWAVLETTPLALREKLKKALFKINSSPELKKELLEKMRYDGFSEPDEKGLSDLQDILKVIM
ncbi:MAG TPA: phosphate/phosphite/phosphonate ABC transporter substrate-binding protein [Candidatus Wallbacteria bacterium]|nr:phosphate/phosphite/phosphonate ABC transporter substrate-binding protein [Candidatus Wallbacteria bacterium]